MLYSRVKIDKLSVIDIGTGSGTTLVNTTLHQIPREVTVKCITFVNSVYDMLEEAAEAFTSQRLSYAKRNFQKNARLMDAIRLLRLD